MSHNRISPDAGWVSPDMLPRGANGRALCRRCGGPIEQKRRRTFCSDECVREHRLRTDPNFARAQVSKRDHGVCAECRLDTEQLRHRIDERLERHREIFNLRHPDRTARIDGLRWSDAYMRFLDMRRKRLWRKLGTAADRHLWEMDHIVPVAQGGGECGLDNLQTLCVRCHRRKTREMLSKPRPADPPGLFDQEQTA